MKMWAFHHSAKAENEGISRERKTKPSIEANTVFGTAELKNATVHLNEIFRDREPEAGALLLVIFAINLNEGLTRSSLLIRCYSGTSIPHTKDGIASFRREHKSHGSGFRTELHRIAEKMMQGMNNVNVIHVYCDIEGIVVQSVKKFYAAASERIERHFGKEERRELSAEPFTGLLGMADLDLLEKKKIIH